MVRLSIPSLVLALSIVTGVHADPPAGFIRETVGSFQNPVGILDRFDARKVIWEREGRVWLLDAVDQKPDVPWLDLSDEVGAWRDHGLLGCVLHPAFEANGWIYLLYVVDRHHLLHAGTPEYDPTVNDYQSSTIGRIVRYTARSDDGFESIDPESRLVLLGATAEEGLPINADSHAIGSLLFAEDGTLLVGMGDSASYLAMDIGGPMAGTYTEQSLAEGILDPEEDVGAFRAQMLDSLCGKILRIDPLTGDGISSNPFFDAAAPRSARSMVWTLGLRNPFRMNLVPGSGGHDPAEGNPGEILVADVGWYLREELTLIDRPGLNCGWPFYEGLQIAPEYPFSSPVNPAAPNPLAGDGCEPHFRFSDLFREDTLDPDPVFLNPCGALQAEEAVFEGPEFAQEHFGYLGEGYLDFEDGADATITWNISVPEDGRYRFDFRYALDGHGSSSRPLRLVVDGGVVDRVLPFEATGSWSEWGLQSTIVDLDAGAHVVSLEDNGFSGANIDCLLVRGTSTAGHPEIPEEIPVFVHHRPIFDALHGVVRARVPTFENGIAALKRIGFSGSSVSGSEFPGYCSISGPVFEPSDVPAPDAWPAEWAGVFFADYVYRWIRVGTLDDQGRLDTVRVFDTGQGSMVHLSRSHDGRKLYVIDWFGEIAQYRWDPDGNQSPVASFVSSTDHTWTFSNGDPPRTGEIVEHVFQAVSADPERVDVILTVTDPQGATSTLSKVVSLNNTPPVVQITSPIDGSLYSMNGPTLLELGAMVFDAEHGPEDLVWEWMEVLHHNTHTHEEPPIFEETPTVLITPLGCGVETFWYRMQLVVTDAAGLSTVVYSELHPDCDRANCLADLNRDGLVNGADLSNLLGMWGSADPVADIDGSGQVDGQDLAILLSDWGDCEG
jgi:glucose/arabinose dehydrogenase